MRAYICARSFSPLPWRQPLHEWRGCTEKKEAQMLEQVSETERAGGEQAARGEEGE